MPRQGDNILKCPFCEAAIYEIATVKTQFGTTFEGGRCRCGAVFVHDHSGRMLGEAFTDALAFAYDMDYDAAYSAEEGDYEEALVRFDKRHMRFLEGEGGRFDRSPKYYFLKRKKGL